ncbi:hypothetical protein F5X71_29695 [Nocardia brasiliensis]|uniref:Capsid maturation protease n=1 Tax=Nocardia brasiliensis TaxID=37326 RepID=A0A6G9XYD0_NOCBR|nr:hypothetical protein [Nocardia brasiliensis]QIS05924.1 hypothetical protein F5X71_29695 [Nocardia brasiliensis]
MNFDEYAEAQRQIDIQTAATVYLAASQYQGTDMSVLDWELLLRLLYPTIERARRRSAELARQFYDSERQRHLPTAPPHDIPLAGYRLDWFRRDMEPERRALSQEDAPREAVDAVVLRALKVTEGAGRQTLIHAAETDRPQLEQEPEAESGSPVPAPEVELRPGERSRGRVIGWARVTTGPEPCGFCQMMVSRGPLYGSAPKAGFHGRDRTAIQLFDDGDDKRMRLAMRKWHTGCRCKVVPVFDAQTWPGRDEYLAAKKLWRTSTKGKSGQDAVNAFRRAVEDGYRRLERDRPAELTAAA